LAAPEEWSVVDKAESFSAEIVVVEKAIGALVSIDDGYSANVDVGDRVDSIMAGSV